MPAVSLVSLETPSPCRVSSIEYHGGPEKAKEVAFQQSDRIGSVERCRRIDVWSIDASRFLSRPRGPLRWCGVGDERQPPLIPAYVHGTDHNPSEWIYFLRHSCIWIKKRYGSVGMFLYSCDKLPRKETGGELHICNNTSNFMLAVKTQLH